jgi:hypothetical protein
MSEIKARTVKDSGVELKTEGTSVIISGSINHPKPNIFMEPFLQEVHDNILAKAIKAVDVDITDLQFLNSSGIREFVDWVMKLNELEEEKKYTIKFLCNAEHKWQDSSLSTVTFLNPEYTSKVVVK